jgi:hypothetical protein
VQHIKQTLHLINITFLIIELASRKGAHFNLRFPISFPPVTHPVHKPAEIKISFPARFLNVPA